jgi:hypothetical protein
MIAKLHYDISFDRLCAYVTQQAGKQAEVLAANGVRVSSAGEMAADFELQRSLRPGLEQAVEHISLAWPPGETEKLTNEVMTRAAMLFMEKRGIDPAQTQWVLARHYDEDHPHCHLLLNRVTDTGGVVPDKFSHLRSAKACRKVEKEMGFVDAAKLGAAKTLSQAEQAEPQVRDVVDRLRMKALVAKILEKHLPTVTTVVGLQEALASEGISLKTTLQKEKLQGVVFTAEAYPELHMKGSEVARQYSGGQLRETLEEQAIQAHKLQEERNAREERDAKQREAEQQQQEQEKQAQLAEARIQAQLREVLLTALDRQVPGTTSLEELQPRLALAGVTARPVWQADGELQEISFMAAAFPGREMSGAALGPQYEAVGLSQTLAGQATQRADEQREAAELRERILAQEQQIAQLRQDSKQAEKQGLYGEVAEIDHGKIPRVTAQLTIYQEQAQATEAGRLMLQELAEERADTRQQVQLEGQRALRLPLEEERGNWRSWPAYAERVQQVGFEILEIKGQPAELLHIKSGEKFDLTLMQPGGAGAPSLQQQVAKELNEQEDARRGAERMLVDVVASRRFTSDSELDQRLQERAYKRAIQPDGQAWLHHEPSGRRFAMAELLPNGHEPEAQFKAAMTRRQNELVRGQLEVGPGADGPAAERARQFQQLLEAAGAQVIVGAGLPVAGKTTLEYRYEWKGANLEAVNQALRQVQAAPGVLVREQNEGFQQPQSQWPVRVGEEGRATLVIAATSERTAAERVQGITSLLHEKGAWINAERRQQNGTVELELGYRTKHPDFPALNGMLDRWKTASNKVEVLETPYGRLVRAEVCQVGAGTLPTPAKGIDLPAQKTAEYERD